MSDEGRDELEPAATAEDALRLLESLATDDDFRQRFTSEPQAALSDYNINLPPGEIPDRVELPSKEDLKALADELRDAMTTVGRFRRFRGRFVGRFAPLPGPSGPESSSGPGLPPRAG